MQKSSGARQHRYRGKVRPDSSKDPMVPAIAKIILESGHTITQIAVKTGVSNAAMYGWINGSTRRPCRVTVDFVLKRCGYRMAIIDDDSRPNTEIKPIKRLVTWTPRDIVR